MQGVCIVIRKLLRERCAMKQIMVVFIALSLTSMLTHANDKTGATFYGPVTLSNKEFDHLNAKGPTTLEGVTVTGPLEVFGPLTIKDSKIKNLTVMGPLTAKKLTMVSGEINGPVKLDRSQVEGKITINGPLTAEECKFKDTIDIATTKMTLEHSTATHIHVRKNDSWLDKPQKIYLTSKTIVNGDITFEAGNGLVYLKKGSTLKGEVKGGKKIEKL